MRLTNKIRDAVITEVISLSFTVRVQAIETKLTILANALAEQHYSKSDTAWCEAAPSGALPVKSVCYMHQFTKETMKSKRSQVVRHLMLRKFAKLAESVGFTQCQGKKFQLTPSKQVYSNKMYDTFLVTPKTQKHEHKIAGYLAELDSLESEMQTTKATISSALYACNTKAQLWEAVLRGAVEIKRDRQGV